MQLPKGKQISFGKVLSVRQLFATEFYKLMSFLAKTTNGVTEMGLTDTYSNWHDFTVRVSKRITVRDN